MIQFKDECLEEGVVSNLRTQEQCDEFSKWLGSKGMRWCNDKSYEEHNPWWKYKKETYYHPFEGCYGDIAYYTADRYKILSYEEALLEEDDYVLPVIDLNKCKKYHVWNNNFDIIKKYIRLGVFVFSGRLYCIPEQGCKDIAELDYWKYWEEIDENKEEIKEQISKLKSELEKLEDMLNE